MKIHYLEIVTPEVKETCRVYSVTHQVEFSQPLAELGHARIAELSNGGLIAIRAPMHADEEPCVRPYWLVDDAQSALDAAIAEGAVLVHPVLEISDHGHFAIYEQGGLMQGLWQLPVG